MGKYIELEAVKRSVVGKQVRHLRSKGLIPGVLYGPTFDSLPLQVKWTELRPVLREAGGSQLIELKVDNESFNALVRDVQRDPLRGDVLHIDFYRVRMDVAIRTDVPVVVTGSDERIADLGGIVSQEMTAITVECLPGDLPSEVTVDLSLLQEVGDSILVADLPRIEGVSYLAHENDVVVSSGYPAALTAEEEEEEGGLLDVGAEPELIGRDDDDDFDDAV